MPEWEYRHLASKMRVLAKTTSDPFEKRELLLIAQRYEMLAERAAQREAARPHARRIGLMEDELLAAENQR